ncbi:MAG: hypothetical protein NUV51_09550 [Sulfuricaulis sp.]|nr:hypothetical protein [Sulfuricaulis sp.]
MVKWFCDVCDLEIAPPMCPVQVATYQTTKGRTDPDIGWSESDDVLKVFCHAKCADVLELEIKGAFDNARRVVKNNA